MNYYVESGESGENVKENFLYEGDCLCDRGCDNDCKNEYGNGVYCCFVNNASVDLDKKQRVILLLVILGFLGFCVLLGLVNKVLIFTVGAFVLFIIFLLLGLFSIFS